MLLLLPLLLPLVVTALTALAGWRRPVAWAGVAASVAVAASGGVMGARILDHGPVRALGNLVRVDALSAFMVLVIGVVATLAGWSAISYLDGEIAQGHATPASARRYGVLVGVFQTAMLAAVVAENLGVMWVAIEATTIATVFLVGQRRTRASLEASWKYLVIGSVGVAIAFLGTVLLYFVALQAGGRSVSALDWSALVASAPQLDPGVTRLAVGLLILGYGTKVGFAPMHTWLPDAHSEAPAPVSALMSGVLLAVAFSALLRIKVIADRALGVDYARSLLIVMGLLSLLVAASMLIAQRDYKRMLAYSSIEHMGLLALGAAAGTPLAVAGVLLHVLGHGVAKAVLFLASGEILLAEGTTEIAAVRGLLASRPVVGGTFGFGLLALLGLPPFSLFASELAMIRGALAASLGWAVAVALVCMVVIFGAVIDHGRHLLLGDPPASPERHEANPLAAAPLVGGLALSAALGVSTWPLERLLHAAAAIAA